jgi:hypothetical protein
VTVIGVLPSLHSSLLHSYAHFLHLDVSLIPLPTHHRLFTPGRGDQCGYQRLHPRLRLLRPQGLSGVPRICGTEQEEEEDTDVLVRAVLLLDVMHSL